MQELSAQSEAALVRRSAVGDRAAFVELVRRHEEPLARLIRYSVQDPAAAEDVQQETLLAAWLGIAKLRDPDKAGPWLLQIARNRCRDYHRHAMRQHQPLPGSRLDLHAHRTSPSRNRHRALAAEVLDALETANDPELHTAQLFYLKGLSIAEISARGHIPPGTVKRRLYQARSLLRATCGIPARQRSLEMAKYKQGSKRQPFPTRLPGVMITRSRASPFPVACKELLWWCIVPRVGQRTLWATYDPPEWKLASVTDMRAARPALVHEEKCVEIEIDEWSPRRGWSLMTRTMYARLTETAAQYLAVVSLDGGKRRVYTFLDRGFDWAWGELPRRFEDSGRYAPQKDGTFKQTTDDPAAIGAGIFNVKVAAKRFACLRAFYLDGPLSDRHSTLIEAYFTRSGRTVLQRHHCQTGHGKGHVSAHRPPVVIDGVRFLPWYDCVGHLACGIKLR